MSGQSVAAPWQMRPTRRLLAVARRRGLRGAGEGRLGARSAARPVRALLADVHGARAVRATPVTAVTAPPGRAALGEAGTPALAQGKEEWACDGPSCTTITTTMATTAARRLRRRLRWCRCSRRGRGGRPEFFRAPRPGAGVDAAFPWRRGGGGGRPGRGAGGAGWGPHGTHGQGGRARTACGARVPCPLSSDVRSEPEPLERRTDGMNSPRAGFPPPGTGAPQPCRASGTEAEAGTPTAAPRPT